MPEESKKNQHKGKNEPKDQRRRRQARQPAGPVEKKPEKQPERQVEKQSKEPEKPAYEPPGPEFYKNLKRETDEILKITEEANTKYKKKEIQSNWAKYEMSVESYEEIDEQENMGADYEKLIQAPSSVGGHFQFKHEKSWDTDTGPSLYDKYFQINMDLLSLAVSTIPFYERNSIEQSMFNENDIVTMNHRATKFKQKYYNDKKYNTPELEAQEKILKSLASPNSNEDTVNDIEREDMCKIHDNDNASSETTLSIKENSTTYVNVDVTEKESFEKEKPIPFSVSSPVNEKILKVIKQSEEIKFKPDITTPIVAASMLEDTKIQLKDDAIIREDANESPEIIFMKAESPKIDNEIKPLANTQITLPKDTPKKPVIESPEDLEKWLDDFLDG